VHQKTCLRHSEQWSRLAQKSVLCSSSLQWVLLVTHCALLFTYSWDVHASEYRHIDQHKGGTYMQHRFACLWICLHAWFGISILKAVATEWHMKMCFNITWKHPDSWFMHCNVALRVIVTTLWYCWGSITIHIFSRGVTKTIHVTDITINWANHAF